MSSTKTLIWAGILLLLGAFYYFYEIQGGQKRQEVASKRDLLFQLAADEVTAFAIQRAHEPVHAEKRDGHWYLTAPLPVRGDDQKYLELVRYFVELRSTRVVEEQPTALEPYGLTAPRLTIHVMRQGQAAPAILHLGAANPTGGSYYASVEGRPTVYLVSGMVQDVLDASLHALRDKTVLAFVPAEIQELHLRRGAEPPVIVQRQAEDTWRLSAPVQAPADVQQVRALLQRLRDAKIHTFIAEEAADLAPYGLQTPLWHVALHLGQGHAPLTLSLGDVDTERKGVYAKHDETAQVFLLPQEFWNQLPKTTTALRDKTLMHYERDHVTRLELRTPHETIGVASSGPRHYTLEQPESTPGDGDAIYSLLWDVRDLKAKDFVSETSDALPLYGLDVPRWHVTVWEKAPTAAQATTHQLALGAEAPDGAGVYARLGEAPAIYLVGHAEAERLLRKTAFDLRNKRLLTFSTNAVSKLRVQSPTTQFTVERAGKGWKLIEPHTKDIPQRWKIDHLLYQLSILEYTGLVASDTAQELGLGTPQLHLTLWQQDGTTLGPLVIGKRVDTTASDATTVYAQVGSRPPLYTLKAEFLKEVPNSPAELVAEK